MWRQVKAYVETSQAVPRPATSVLSTRMTLVLRMQLHSRDLYPLSPARLVSTFTFITYNHLSGATQRLCDSTFVQDHTCATLAQITLLVKPHLVTLQLPLTYTNGSGARSAEELLAPELDRGRSNEVK